MDIAILKTCVLEKMDSRGSFLKCIELLRVYDKMIYQSTNAIRKHLTPAQEATWPKEDYRVAVYLMLLEQQCTEEATTAGADGRERDRDSANACWPTWITQHC